MPCKCPYCGTDTATLPPIALMQPERLLLWEKGYIQLRPSEAIIIEQLLDAHPRPRTAEQLFLSLEETFMDRVDPPDNKIVAVHISVLRRKLREAGAPIAIATRAYGVGYALCASNPQLIDKLKGSYLEQKAHFSKRALWAIDTAA